MNPKYADLLHLPHPVSRRHPPMKREDRAAQFAPFAALTGYDAACKETARSTDSFCVLDEAEKLLMSELLCAAVETQEEIAVTWFRPDEKKDGGAYRITQGRLRRIDEIERLLIFADGLRVPIESVTAVSPVMP